MALNLNQGNFPKWNFHYNINDQIIIILLFYGKLDYSSKYSTQLSLRNPLVVCLQ